MTFSLNNFLESMQDRMVMRGILNDQDDACILHCYGQIPEAEKYGVISYCSLGLGISLSSGRYSTAFKIGYCDELPLPKIWTENPRWRLTHNIVISVYKLNGDYLREGTATEIKGAVIHLHRLHAILEDRIRHEDEALAIAEQSSANAGIREFTLTMHEQIRDFLSTATRDYLY